MTQQIELANSETTLQLVKTISGGEVDPEAVIRLQEQEAAAFAAGFAPRPPVYALGTRVVSMGAENFRRSRLEFEKLPLATEVLKKLIDRVMAEHRLDTEPVRVRDLEMLPSGHLTRGGAKLLLTDTSFRQLLSRSACEEASAAATYLATIPPARRAVEVNSWLRETPEHVTAVVRHRNNLALTGNGRQAYAIVSERYTPLDTDRLARIMLEQDVAPGDARGEVTYDGDRAELVLRWHSDIQPETCAAGEIFRAVAGLRSADDGTSSIIPFAGLDRNLCLNLIILDHAEVSLGKKRHTGNDVASFLYTSLAEAVDRVRYFAEKWDSARSTRLDAEGVVRDFPSIPEDVTAEKHREEVVSGVFRGLLTSGVLALPGYRREQAIGELITAWKREPEFTKVGLVNAVSRAAHESELRGAWGTQTVQASASKLLGSRKALQYVPAGADF